MQPKALLDALVGLHELRVRLAQTPFTTSPTRLKQRVAIIWKSGSLCVIATPFFTRQVWLKDRGVRLVRLIRPLGSSFFQAVGMARLKQTYEGKIYLLMQWIRKQQKLMGDRKFPNNLEEVHQLYLDLVKFKQRDLVLRFVENRVNDCCYKWTLHPYLQYASTSISTMRITTVLWLLTAHVLRVCITPDANILAAQLEIEKNKRNNLHWIVDRIRFPTVSYLPFHKNYSFFISNWDVNIFASEVTVSIPDWLHIFKKL